MAASGAGRLRIVIVDGDETERRCLRSFLDSIDEPQSVNEASSALQAALAIEALTPDVVLLDIDLAGAGTIGALRSPDGPCVVVMTAHPEQTLPACELEAVERLTKPVTREHLATALKRVRRHLAERHIAKLALEIAATASVLRGAAEVGALPSSFPDKMMIRVRRRMVALPVADIAWIEGASQYSRVHTKTGEFVLSRSLSTLESALDPSQFFRIHRSAIVNAAHVRDVMSRGNGRYDVYLHGGEAIPLGRKHREVLYRLLARMNWRGQSPLANRSPARNTGNAQADSPPKSGCPRAVASS